MLSRTIFCMHTPIAALLHTEMITIVNYYYVCRMIHTEMITIMNYYYNLINDGNEVTDPVKDPNSKTK